METAAVENQVERPRRDVVDKKIAGLKRNIQACALCPLVGSFDGGGGDVGSDDAKALLRQPDGIAPRAAAEIKRTTGVDSEVLQGLFEVLVVTVGIPGKLPRDIAFVPF